MSRTPEIIESAEQMVFASVLLEPAVMANVADVLEPKDFFDKLHQKFWATCLELFAENMALEPVIIAERTSGSGDDELGYLVDLQGSISSATNARHYAEMVREDARKRQVARAGQQIAEQALTGKDHSTAMLGHAQELLMEIADNTTSQGLEPANEEINAVLKASEDAKSCGGRPAGLLTGFGELDKLIMGLKPTSFNLIAARPSMGKTALALNIVDNVLRTGKTVALWSLEMERLDLVQRMVSSSSGIGLSSIMTGRMNANTWEKLISEAGYLDGRIKNLLIDDSGTVTATAIRAGIRRAQVRQKIDLVVIDYLQLMTGSGRTENRQQEISGISRSLKLIAKDFKIPMIALSQLSRAVEARSSQEPTLSDLRDSGAIEQDADTVTFIYRKDDEVRLKVAKNRNGPTGKIRTMKFVPTCVRFVSTEEHRTEVPRTWTEKEDQ